ncbi:MAG: hypothetical protein E3J37_05865 [Anaerolineales bacterium]|nr:MAG: hypothetical protein E3J37_05865 [Anaerolineales bacterium]
MIETPCVFCGELVYASPKPETWGIEWKNNTWVHYKCANDLFEAIRSIQNADEFDMTPEQEKMF